MSNGEAEECCCLESLNFHYFSMAFRVTISGVPVQTITLPYSLVGSSTRHRISGVLLLFHRAKQGQTGRRWFQCRDRGGFFLYPKSARVRVSQVNCGDKLIRIYELRRARRDP